MFRSRLRCALIALLVVAVGCGGGSGSVTGPGGTLVIRLRGEAPAAAALVTFTELRVGGQDGQFVPLSLVDGSPRTCDLNQLTHGRSEALSTTPVPAGHYGQLRLVISNATLYFANQAGPPACAPRIPAPRGRQASVAIPPGEVRIAAQFDVASGATTTLTLEFDGDRSFLETATDVWELRAVIRLASVEGP